jgi:hypothetical protein
MNFSFCLHAQTGLVPNNAPMQSVPEALYRKIKRPEHEAGESRLPDSEI